MAEGGESKAKQGCCATCYLACCCCCAGGEQEEDLKALRAEKAAKDFTKDGANDISKGPAGNRSCTDLPCCIIFIVALVAYVVVTLLGLKDGDIGKLYKPRDFGGNYCGVETQWDGGVGTLKSLETYEYSTYTMNVSSTIDPIVKQFICSKAAQDLLFTKIGSSGWTRTKWDEYMCTCCATPCDTCDGAIEQDDPSATIDGSAGSTSELATLVASRLTAVAGFGTSNVLDLFSSSGANGDLFSTDVMSTVTQYVHSVCAKSCDLDYETVGNATTYAYRDYVFSLVPDDDLYDAWELVKADSGTLGTVAQNDFTFKAFSEDDCPYDPVMCVAFPGLTFTEAALSYCTLEIAAEVTSAVGSAFSDIMQSSALTDISNGATESLGEQWGAIQASWPAFVLTCVASFVIGILFLVLVRFFVGICVWISIFLILVLILAFAGLCYVKSIQCAGYTLFQTGQQTTTQVVTFASTTVSSTISGDTVNEDLGEDGNTYRGVQYMTQYGTECQKWTATSPHDQDYGTTYYDSSTGTETQGIGDHNYCRNPYNSTDVNKADTIWCFTTNTELRWEECLPIGLNPPVCSDGYAVSGQTGRDVLLYACYVLLGIAGLWVLIVLFFLPKIMLAIRCTKVAARFLASTPSVLIVPILQSLSTMLWCIGWACGAAFLISQVPDGYTPTSYYADYSTANHACVYEGSGDLGYPVSDAFRDESCAGPNGECWRCAPPRYMIDYYVAYVFFIYLWLNAYVIAAGQCIIAGAVGVWFFNQQDGGRVRGALRQSIWNTTRYHMGSIAFGAFIIAVVQFVRYCMKFLEKQAQARNNRVMVWIARAIQCCIYCFEKSLEYLNKLAYIQIALLGKNFCTSAKKAFYLVLRHFSRFAAVLILGTAIDRIGLVSIVCLTTFAGYCIQTTLYPDVSPLCPTLLFILNGYVVGKLYMNVFHLAIDTSLQCFIACEEMGVDAETVPKELRRLVPDTGKSKKNEPDEPPRRPPHGTHPAAIRPCGAHLTSLQMRCRMLRHGSAVRGSPEVQSLGRDHAQGPLLRSSAPPCYRSGAP